MPRRVRGCGYAVDVVDIVQEVQGLAHSEFGTARPERPDVLGQTAPAETDPAFRNWLPIRLSWPIASASWVTSAPTSSQISAMALMKEILVARNALAAALTNSAVATSVTSSGVPAASGAA